MRDVFTGSAWQVAPRADRIGKPLRRETVRPDERPATEPKPLKTPEREKAPEKVPAKAP